MLIIDITDTQVRLVRGSATDRKMRLTHGYTRELMPEAVQNGYISDSFLVAGEIDEILKSARISERSAIITINSSAVLFKELTLPRPRLNAKSDLIEGMVINDMGLDYSYNITYTIVADVVDKGAHQMKLVVSAVPQDLVDQYALLAKQAGLRLKHLYIGSTCIPRLVARSKQTFSNHMPLLLLHQERRFIHIDMFEDSNLAVSRFAKADPGDYEPGVDYLRQAMFDNVFRFIHFTEQATGVTPIQEIQFYGDIADEEEFAGVLGSFNLPVRTLERPPEVKISGKHDFSFTKYASMIGALYPPDKKNENLDLLNSSERRSKRATRAFTVDAAIIALITSLAVVAGAAYGLLMASIKNDELTALTNHYLFLGGDNMTSIVDQKTYVVQAYEAYINNVTLAKSLFDFQPKVITNIPNVIKVSMPEGVEFDGNITVNGYSVHAKYTADSFHLVKVFITNLRSDDNFDDIKYPASVTFLEDEGGRTEECSFELTLRIKGGNGLETEIK